MKKVSKTAENFDVLMSLDVDYVAVDRIDPIKKRYLYNVWRYLVDICTDPTHPSYKKNGISKRWENSFKDFLSDMLPTYRKGKKITLINPRGKYEASNCLWLTPRQRKQLATPIV